MQNALQRRWYGYSVLRSAWIRALGLAMAVAIAYVLGARLGLALLTNPDDVAVFWPAAGIAAGTLIALGRGARWPIAIGITAATIVANLMGDRNLAASVVFALCNAGETLLIAGLIERHFGRSFRLDSMTSVLGLLAATVIGVAVSGVGGALGFILFHNSEAPFLTTWWNWFASDTLGVISVAPLAIGLVEALHERPTKWELAEGAILLAVLALVSTVVLAAPGNRWFAILPVALLVPLLLCLAARCRPVFAAAAAFVLAFVIVWTITFGFGHLGDSSIPLAVRVYAAQTALLALCGSTLVLSALFAERRRHVRALESGNLALENSNRRLQLALDCAELGTWSLDLKNRQFDNDVRDRCIHGHGLNAPPQSLARMRAQVHPDDLSLLDAAFAGLKTDSGHCRAEYRLKARPQQEDAGRERWVAIEGMVVRDPTGHAVQLLGVTRDISERKQAEQTLAERNAQLALAGQFALVGTFTLDVEAQRMQVTPGYVAMHGLPEGTEDISRDDWRSGVHPDDLPGVEAGFQEAMAALRREHYCEYRIVRAGNEIRWIDSRSLISYGRDGTARVVGANIDVTSRKQTEAALAAHKASLADALAAGNVMAFEWNAVTGRSNRTTNTIALPAIENTEKGRNDFFKQVHPDDRARFKAKIRELTPNNPSYALTLRLYGPNGQPVWLEETAKGEFDATGTLLRVKGLTRNITDRKKAELALEERNIQVALAERTTLVGSFAYDCETEIMQISEGYATIHGLPEGTTAIPRSHCLADVHPDDIGRVQESRGQSFRARRREYNVEYRIRRPDGEMRWVETRCFIAYAGDGQPERVLGVSIDVTERKMADQALNERSLHLALAAKAALVGSFAADVETERMRISAGYSAIHGFPEGTTEITRSDWLGGVHPEDRGRLKELRSRAFRKQIHEYGADYRVIRSGGEVRWIDARIFVAYSDEGRPQRTMGVDIDITERKRSEEQQRKLIAELDHRVKNVLATVVAIIAQTQEGERSQPDFVAALDHRIRSLARTHEMLSQNRWAGVPLRDIVQCEFAPYEASRVEIDGPHVELKPEAAQAMAMVVHELTTNAAKYGALSTRSGRVRLSWCWLRNGSSGWLAMEWQESGGPPVQAPSRAGYGTTIVNELVPYELNGTVALDFAPEGLRCSVEMPPECISKGRPPLSSPLPRLHPVT